MQLFVDIKKQIIRQAYTLILNKNVRWTKLQLLITVILLKYNLLQKRNVSKQIISQQTA